MSNKSNTSKAKNNIQKATLPIAKEITIKFTDGEPKILNSLSQSPLFKIYLKTQIQNKPLFINYESELVFLNSKINFQITLCTLQIPDDKTSSSFMIDTDTNIIFDLSSMQIDLLSKEIESKLSLENNDDINCELTEENKKILKSFLESKISTSVEKVQLINEEKIFEKIKNILSLQFQSVNDKENKILLNKDKITTYSYKGILLSGVNGIGKTHMIKYIKSAYLSQNNISFFDIDIYKNFDDKEAAIKYIKSTFKIAKLLSPAVIFFESIDSIFGKKDEEGNNSSSIEPFEFNSLISSFITQIDSLPSNVVVIASCLNSNKVSSELINHNRFDCVITFSPPNHSQRKELIKYIAQDFTHNLSEDDIISLSEKTHGFVAGDLIKLFKEAYTSTLVSSSPQITKSSLDLHLQNIKPINLKDIIIDIPNVKWTEIGGNTSIIASIRQSVEWPLKHPESFARLGISPPNGTLLYGPPGCSKTLIAKALASESGLNFFAVKGPELFSKYVGDTEKAVRDVFKKAKMASPSIIFFDEIDAMATQRGGDSGSGVEDKVLCQLLNEMDGVEGKEKVVIFAATNRPDILDKALIRPGRFDRLIYIPPPDEKGREEIFKIFLSKMTVEEGVDFKELSQMTEMFSGAEIAKVAREAGMMALSEDTEAKFVGIKHIKQAIKSTKPIIDKKMLEFFENFSKIENNI